jgi:hypothetical protein
MQNTITENPSTELFKLIKETKIIELCSEYLIEMLMLQDKNHKEKHKFIRELFIGSLYTTSVTGGRTELLIDIQERILTIYGRLICGSKEIHEWIMNKKIVMEVVVNMVDECLKEVKRNGIREKEDIYI